jgi:hypothetical protein
MSKFDEAVEKYAAEVERLKLNIPHDFLVAVTKSLGPSIYNADAETVASSDQSELDTVKNKFLIGKLGLADSPELDKAIAEVVEKFGPGNKKKYRAIFYALLAIKFKKESLYK